VVKSPTGIAKHAQVIYNAALLLVEVEEFGILQVFEHVGIAFLVGKKHNLIRY
jgi:hypothetical protein